MERGELIELDEGLTTATAISLGLVDGETASLEKGHNSGTSSYPSTCFRPGLFVS